jgi:hypothetical protein
MTDKSKADLLNTILDTWRRLGGRISIIPKGPKQWLLVAVIAAALGGGIWFLGNGSAGEITVEVSGAVRNPGLFTLPEGSRTEDAITAAGGLASDADTAGLNRAAILADGQQVIVPSMSPAPAPGATMNKTVLLLCGF